MAASSPVLASILSSTGALVELEAPCLSDPILGLLFDYIYTGILPYLDNKQDYLNLLAAAQYLEMDELLNALKTTEDTNTSGIPEVTTSTNFTLLPPGMDCYERPYSGCSSENKVHHFTANVELSNGAPVDSDSTCLSFEDETEDTRRSCSTCLSSSCDENTINNASKMAVNNCITETDVPSHNLSQSISNFGELKEVSIVCPDREKDQFHSAGAIKQETWQRSKEEEVFRMEDDEDRSYSSYPAGVQENENTQGEKTPHLCLRGEIKANEMQSNTKDKSHGSHCSFTSSPRCGVVPVICHSSRAAMIQVSEGSTKPPHYTGSCTAFLSKSTDNDDIVKEIRNPNQDCINNRDYIWKQNQNFEASLGHIYEDISSVPKQDHNCARYLYMTKNNKHINNEQSHIGSHNHIHCHSEEDSNNVIQYESDHNCKDFSQIQDISKMTATKEPLHHCIVAPFTKGKSDTIIKFMYKDTCAKRKVKEEHSSKCSKSTTECHNLYGSKTELHQNRADIVYPAPSATTESNTVKGSLSVFEQDKTLKYENTSNCEKLYRSLAEPSESNTSQPVYSATEESYCGHLYYHCHSQSDTPRPSAHIQFSPNFQFTPEFSPNYSKESREENDGPLFKNSSLGRSKQHSAALGKEQVVLLDVSDKSAEMLVSYKHTSEVEKTCVTGFTDENITKTDYDPDSLDKAENKISATEGTYQGGNVRHGASGHEGGRILTSSLTSCASACGNDCAYVSMSSSLSDHIPLSPATIMQTNISEHLSTHVHHPFQCSLCERSFSQRGSLNRHVRSHLGLRPFPCPQCPMTFSRQYHVMEHMRVHQRSALGNDLPKPPASSV